MDSWRRRRITFFVPKTFTKRSLLSRYDSLFVLLSVFFYLLVICKLTCVALLCCVDAEKKGRRKKSR